MKFLKKLALDLITPSGTIFPSNSSGAISVNTASSDYLNKIDGITKKAPGIKLNNHLDNGSFLGLILQVLEKISSGISEKLVATNCLLTGDATAIRWMPLIKATTVIENSKADDDLIGQSILCVGGRSDLYPTYQHLVEKSGGRMLCFRGGSCDGVEQLHILLESADMVICPVDCVNHEAYFTVRNYCQCTNKPCAFLDRSLVASFQKGIEKLASTATS